MKYPTRNGISISPYELDLPTSHLSPTCHHENNHHLEFTARSMGRFLLTRTLRNLDGLQFIMPLDVHNALHQEFEPPAMPTPQQAIDRLYEAYMEGEPLRYGSAHHFELKPISDELWRQLTSELVAVA